MIDDINDDLKDLEYSFGISGVATPMHLRVFDKNDDGDYIDPEFGFTIAYRDLEVFVEQKTLTQSDLAAEHWCEVGEALFWDPKRGRLHPEQSKLFKNATGRAALLLRAATHPDYTEDLDED